MALQASGAISTADIATELDLSTSAAFNTGDIVLRGMAGGTAVADSQYSIDDLYGTLARTLFSSKPSTNMVIGQSGGTGEIYGFGSSFGSLSNQSASFSNGVSGTIYQVHITTTVLNQMGVDVSPNDENDFPYDKQVKGPKLTFYHSGTGSTKIIQCTNGSALNSLVAVGTGADTAWFSSRVGETVTMTIEPV